MAEGSTREEPVMLGPAMTAAGFERLACEGVPYVGQLGCHVRRFEPGFCDVLLPWQAMLLRPGGTLCGPALMGLADIALWGAVLSRIGRVELAVTTDLTMHFLSKPRPGDVVAEARLLKLGRRLAVAEATLHPAAGGDALAHAVATYAIPRQPTGEAD